MSTQNAQCIFLLHGHLLVSIHAQSHSAPMVYMKQGSAQSLEKSPRQEYKHNDPQPHERPVLLQQ